MIAINQLRLPAVSPEGMRALDLLNQDEPDVRALTDVILHDSMLALSLIKYANSPLYRRDTAIDTIHGAIRVLGLRNIRSAILFATIRTMTGRLPDNCQIIMRHCIDCSFLAARLAHSIQPQIGDEMAFLGLIHDTGMLILASNFPDVYAPLITRSIEKGELIGDLEEAEFGVRHDDIIERLFKDFRLPMDQITLLSSYHREVCLPDGAPELTRRMILDLAHALWIEQVGDRSFKEHTGELNIDEMANQLGITPTGLQAVRDEYNAIQA